MTDSNTNKRVQDDSPSLGGKVKKAYVAPLLHVYGDLSAITRGTGSKKPGDTKGMKVKPSDPRLKTNIEWVGRHPIGVGLYLYRYLPEMRDEYGDGVHLGVMADELERVLPHAVSVGPDGYRRVDYAQLSPALSAGMLQA
ncbi:MAG: hypothetical protein RLZZ271_861 [Pseudomonadota bacterium]|jgi:hypothetical protein